MKQADSKRTLAAGLVVLAGALAILSAGAADLPIAVVTPEGRPAPAGAVRLDIRKTQDAGVESYACRLTGLKDGPTLVRLEARLPVARGWMHAFDGRKELPLTGVRTNALMMGAFPLGAVWGEDGRAAALALGAEAGDSYADLVLSPTELTISVPAALMRKGSVYETVFHRIPFNPKYGAMDAFAGYYPLYPRRFKRDPDVDPNVYGINATYSSWRRADPEPCRFMNATIECCIGASRTWGDVNDAEQPVGPRNTAYSWDEEIGYIDRKGKYHRKMNGEISQAQFDAILAERLGFGYLCGVGNSYYVMALANISNEIAKRHPDSVAVGKAFTDNSYPYSTDVFTFPECSWGREIRRQLKELSEKADIAAVYFDVARPRAVYRGERLKEMKNVSWDAYGPGVVRGIGSGKLFEYVRTLKAKKSRYRIGVATNTKYEHISDILYADTTESECCPWDRDKPFPIERRLAAGEKGYLLWEGFSTDEFDPNFRQWPQADKDRLINALSRFSIHASFRAGAALPVCFMSEYTALMSHAFCRMSAAGWKPVPGARSVGEDWEVARYGLGADAWLAVNNLSNVVRTAALEIYPREIASGRAGSEPSDRGWLFVPFYGGRAQTRLGKGREGVSFKLGPMLAGVLECVGELKGQGTLSAEWAGDFDALKLKVVSRDFRGELLVKDAVDAYRRVGEARRTLKPGESAEIVFANTELKGILAAIRAGKSVEPIRHAATDDARDMAERMACYLAKATGARNKPSVSPDPALSGLTVAAGEIVLSAEDRWELSRLVNRFLNLLNRERHPDYRPPTPMPSSDRAMYPFLRL